MHYVALATDCDSTVAHHGDVDAPTLAALQCLRGASRKPVLVTGRELDDLIRVLPEVGVFDLVVADGSSAASTREAMHDAIERKYTLPA